MKSTTTSFWGTSTAPCGGDDFLFDNLCGLSFKLSVPSFYQVNPAQTQVLYEKALEFAALTGTETVFDLYCGIGTISLVLARQAALVYGAEVVPQAVEDAKDNAHRNHIENARFFCADAGEAAARLAEQGVRPQVVCVDPPRKGLAPQVVDTIAAMAPARVVYVLLRPGHPGPGRGPLCPARLHREPGRGGGHVPPHRPCGDGCQSGQKNSRW